MANKALTNKVIYQVYPKSFLDTNGDGVGDINGIREKLSYLADLGIDYLWLSPICCSPQYDNGYDISDYENIDPMFGTNEEYELLIQEARQLGIKIMMDLVLNHTSDEHIWFRKAKQNDPKYKNYYIFRKQPNDLQSVFGNSAWTYCEEVGEYYLHFFDTHQPDLNWENPEVRKELHDMINRWIAKGVEGFRLDVIDMIGKEPDRLIGARGPKFYEYLKELQNETFGERLLTVGECWGASFDDAKKMCGKDGLTQVFHFHQLTTTNINFDKWNQAPFCLKKLIDVLLPWQNDFSGIEAVVMNNHDSPRLPSLWLDDQKYRKESAALLIMLFGLMKGNLYVYQGEEIGMTNAHFLTIEQYNDVETKNKYAALKRSGLSELEIMKIIAPISRDNARTPMQWDGKLNAGFSQKQPWLAVNGNFHEVNVETDQKSEFSLYRLYQNVIAFRKVNATLLDHPLALDVMDESNERVLHLQKGNVFGYYNFSGETVVVANKGIGSVLFHNYLKDVRYGDEIVLHPYEAVVFQRSTK